MSIEHPDEASLGRFMRGAAPGAEGRAIVAHLLTGCDHCSSVTSSEWKRGASSALGTRSESKLPDPQLAERGVRSQREGVDDLWRRLEPLPHSRRRVVIRNSRRYQTVGLLELLLEMAFEAGFDDPQEALSLTELGVDVAECLDAELLGEALIHDYRARALGYRANALRINSDYRRAEALLAHASDLLQWGSGDVLEEARLLRFQAYLHGDRGQLTEAIRLVRRAIRLYRRVGDPGLANRVAITLGAYLGQDGRPDQAVDVLRKTLEVLDPEDSRLVLGCRHNLALNLKESGRLEESLEVLRESRDLYSKKGESMILLKLQTIEGDVAELLGNPVRAERAYKGAIRGYEQLGIPFDAAYVALNLAGLYLAQGRTEEVLDLSAKLQRTFRDLDTPREAMAAVALFREAAQRKAVTASVLAEIRSRLESVQKG